MSTTEHVDTVLDSVARIDTTAVRAELENLRAIRAWALRQLGIDYQIGDRVRITAAPSTDNGWRPYRECLIEGATGCVTDIRFNRWSCDGRGAWHAVVALDRAWDTSPDGARRWWKGRAEDTPPGMIPPSPYDQEHYPQGKQKRFSLLATSLVKDTDTPSDVGSDE